MAVTVHSQQQDNSSSGTFLQINTNGFTGLSAGDLMLSHFVFNVTGATITLPSGWTQIVKTEGSSMTSQLAYKYADASDVAGQVISFSKGAGSQVLGLLALHIKGMRTVSAIGASTGRNNTSSTTATADSVTPTEANSMILMCGICDQGSTGSTTISGYTIATSPPTFTELIDSNLSPAYTRFAAYGVRPEFTATGSGTATISQAANSNVHLLVVSAPQSFVVADTVTPAETLRYNLSSLIRDTITLTDSVTSATLRAWTNLTKSISTWVNQSKS